jgi:hypothetical protein
MGTLSHTSYMANANGMIQIPLEYNLNNLMRRFFSHKEKSKRMHTLRTTLTKVVGPDTPTPKGGH